MGKVLIACEESQAVTKEMRVLGIEAYSCDIQPCSGGYPEWHIQGDVTPLLEQDWDMIIAFPPCTYLSNAGARHLYPKGILNKSRYRQGLAAKKFFLLFLNADCEKIVIENPIHSKIFNMPQHTQTIHPYQFGHQFSKATRLWIKGLPNLTPTNIISQHTPFMPNGKTIKKQGDIAKVRKSIDRSKTFPGIAKAMAQQWGVLVR